MSGWEAMQQGSPDPFFPEGRDAISLRGFVGFGAHVCSDGATRAGASDVCPVCRASMRRYERVLRWRRVRLSIWIVFLRLRERVVRGRVTVSSTDKDILSDGEVHELMALVRTARSLYLLSMDGKPHPATAYEQLCLDVYLGRVSVEDLRAGNAQRVRAPS